jgi:type I restriction enzyme M protein
MELEKSVQFGTEIGTKAADIVVYSNNTNTTAQILLKKTGW